MENQLSNTLSASAWNAFLSDDGGQELAEFALVLSAFSIIAMVCFALISTMANGTLNTQQNSLNNAAVNADSL
jgi:hypothetical protein